MASATDHRLTNAVKCSAVLFKRGSILSGERLDDDILCDKVAATDVIVTFNGKRYVVPLCAEHKAHHDQAAADRRAKRRGSAPRPRQPQHNLLETALTHTHRAQ